LQVTGRSNSAFEQDCGKRYAPPSACQVLTSQRRILVKVFTAAIIGLLSATVFENNAQLAWLIEPGTHVGKLREAVMKRT